MSARSEQLVLDYLSRAADAAHRTLRSDERMRFIARLRVSIEQQRRAASAVEPAEVRRVLAKFGDPKVLVARERRSLDEAMAPGGDVGGTGTPDEATQVTVKQGAAGQGAAWQDAAGQGMGRPPEAFFPSPQVAGPDDVGQPAAPVPQVAFDPTLVIRRFPRELLALVLLGLGGMLLPFPLWLIGAVTGLTSRIWSTGDKFIGIAGPLIITVAGVGVIGALNKHPGVPVDLHAYVAAVRADASLIFRIGAVLGALYLGARLPRGNRPSPACRSADRRRDLLGGR